MKGNNVLVFACAKVKRLRSMNQDLQKVSSCLAVLVTEVTFKFIIQRLEDSQAQCENLIKNEQRLKAEVAQLKNHSSDGKLVCITQFLCAHVAISSYTLHSIQLQAKHDFVEQELAKNKEREKVTAVELGRLREEVRTFTLSLNL